MRETEPDSAGGERNRGRDRYFRFVAAYNAIEKHLRGVLRQEGSLRRLVEAYATERPWWQDRGSLHVLADLRNVIVHQLPLFYPTEAAVVQFEAIRNRLVEPTPCIPHFQRSVMTVRTEDTLADVLRLISANDFSQFPVYDPDGFAGLLTENGITRWLAHHVSRSATSLKLADVHVSTLLREQEEWDIGVEEQSARYTFVTAATPVDEVVGRFFINPALEVVLITKAGRDNEGLLGIVTQWDALELRGNKDSSG